MTEKLKTRSVEMPITMELARSAVAADGTDLDPLIETFVRGITAALEHEIGQKVMVQTWLWIDDAFPDAIRLPHPVRSVVAVKYRDLAGVEQTLDPADYKLDVQQYETWLVPGDDKAWPVTFDTINAVTVEVIAGMAETPAEVDQNIASYIILNLREQMDPDPRNAIPIGYVDRLLDSLRSYR
jgi:uncharacterized phiE125 gp8 family phage protein